MTGMKWTAGNVPPAEGWYAVIIEGDSETEGPHVYYEYPDFQTFGYWTLPEPDDDPGYPGHWVLEHDMESDSVIAFCGPILIPEDWRSVLDRAADERRADRGTR